MGAIFTSPGNTVIAGIVLLIVIVLVIGAVTGQMTQHRPWPGRPPPWSGCT